MSLTCQEHDRHPSTAHMLHANERFFCITGPIMSHIAKVCEELIEGIPVHERVQEPGEKLLHIHTGHATVSTAFGCENNLNPDSVLLDGFKFAITFDTARRYLPRVAAMF